MKIKSIYISKYRNIPEQKIFFDTDLTSLIIGQNGLGKSNLLEAITLIFVALSNSDVYLNLSNFDGRYFSFEIHYNLKGKSIKITYGINGLYQIDIDDVIYIIREIKNGNDSFYTKTLAKINEDLIPDFFITYYSGQNKRLEDILHKFEKVYIDGLKQNKSNAVLTSRRRFTYLKNFHSPILMLVMSIFKHFKDDSGNYIYKDKLHNLFNHLEIKSIDEFSLTINSPEWVSKIYKDDLSEDFKIKNGFLTYVHSILDENKRDPGKYPYPYWQFKSSLNSLMGCLIESVDVSPYDNSDTKKRGEAFRETVTFDNISIDSFKSEIFKYFRSPLELFYSLEALVLLGCLDVENDLKFNIKKNNELSLTYNMLSEGENQLFIVLGMVLVTGTDEALFLLDEPDTYLNPKWQKEYIHLLEEFNLEDDDSHIITTTHSPLLVQNIEGMENYKYDLVLLCRNEDGTIELDQNDKVITNWRIDQVLTSKYFNLTSTRPKSLDKYIVEKEAIIYNKELNIDEKNNKLDELEIKYGGIPTGESRNEIESLLLINEVLKNLADD